MFVLITGGGRTGTELARLLIEQKYDVRIIEHRREVLARMHRDLPTEVIFEGEATDPEVLERAGIRNADVLAACFANDEPNLVICYVARQRFNVPRTIARVNDPRHGWLFKDYFHVDVSLDNASVMASLIEEEMSVGDLVTLLKLRQGHYSFVEEKLPPNAPAVGIALKDLNLAENCVIAAIIRDEKVMIPRGITIFQAGDEVLAITDRQGQEQISKLFSSKD
jgi:trk system potassium uptake protein